MDSDNDWTNTGLFSPSKARAHQAQAKDWAFVDAWLAKKSASKRPPTCERNEETLQVLLSLASLNDAADEQRSNVDRVERAALQAHAKRVKGNQGLHELLLSNLDRTDDLETLCTLSVVLDCSSPSTLGMGSAIIDLGDKKFTVEQQTRRADSLVRSLRAEQDRVRAELENLGSESLQASPDLPEQTASWMRSTKHLKAKVAEYDDRIASSRAAQSPSLKFEDVETRMADLEAQQSRLEDLNMKLKAFQSLPSNAKAARSSLESAREELRKLTTRRDSLFEQLVER